MLGTSQGKVARAAIVEHHIFAGSDASSAAATAETLGIDLATAPSTTLSNGKLYVVDGVARESEVAPAPSRKTPSKPAATSKPSATSKPAQPSSPKKTTASPKKTTASPKKSPAKASPTKASAGPPLTVDQAAAVQDFMALSGFK
jgi:hypothetical protein